MPLGRFRSFRGDIEATDWLYRCYDQNSDLIYVGVSLDVLRRLKQHNDKIWRGIIVKILAEPFATREDALEAERIAIRDERPRFNKTYNGRRHPIEALQDLKERLINHVPHQLTLHPKMYPNAADCAQRQLRAARGS